ncbi:ATPase AAA [Clostridia bacterium]|nr:ATPase AAA [Clostridia bacterium]
MIFYGPPGVGKTTLANIIADSADMRLFRLNGTVAGTADIKAIVTSALTETLDSRKTLLYLDEIQYLNKKQQQVLLECMENGEITLIASTTENPFFYVYPAVLSRSSVFEFKPVSHEDLLPALERAFAAGTDSDVSADVIDIIATSANGDVRKALNYAEMCRLVPTAELTPDIAYEIIGKAGIRYDKGGDEHYNLLSALQKSIRGSDENAAVHYLARLVASGDLPSICRRLLVIACEDVGLAFPNAVVVVKSCCDAARELGFPEARIPLAEAVILLATSPKSNSAYVAINSALSDVEAGLIGAVPDNLNNLKNSKGPAKYLYPHDYPNHYVKQNYLPENLAGKIYYEFGENKLEQAAQTYRKKIISE